MDSVVEEIVSGLYRDPHLLGWMTVTASLSDLAAVGADPLGILVSEVLPRDLPAPEVGRLQAGIEDACRACGTYVLGGDTSFGDPMVLTGCAVGLVDRGSRLSRLGSRPGDLVFTTGWMGTGNAFALSRLLGGAGQDIAYRPLARLREGRALRGVATACMDTSDGVLATLDQLGRANGVGFALDPGWERSLRPEAAALAAAASVDPWLLLAGSHGDYELVFTVPPTRLEALRRSASEIGWEPVRLGLVVGRPGIVLPMDGREVRIDSAHLRNLAFEASGDMAAYVVALRTFSDEIRRNAGSRLSLGDEERVVAACRDGEPPPAGRGAS